jgi:hypothetical protein
VDFDFEGFGPEGFFTPDARDELLVLSDDGTQLVNGKACKRVKDHALKHFRGIWLRPALPASGTAPSR